MELDREIADFYAGYDEASRLTGAGRLEFLRTQELLGRWLPPPPARVLDVGGGAGAHALPLARSGHHVQLIDPVPLHREQARAASQAQLEAPLTAIRPGDARDLPDSDASADAVLLLGPLYHLPERSDRMLALAEARRILRPGGVLVGAAIGRWASLLDGLKQDWLQDPEFAAIVSDDVEQGWHRNPARRARWFTTAYFHRPEELRDEVSSAGFGAVEVLAVEGPAYLLPDLAERMADPIRREAVLQVARTVESEASVLGATSHLIVKGVR